METSGQHKAFLLLLGLVTVAFFWLLLPFYGAVLWAVILAIVFHPLQRALERRLAPRRNLPAFLSVLVCIVIAIIPMALVLISLVSEVAQVVQRLQDGGFQATEAVADFKAALPQWTQRGLERLGIDDLPGLLARLNAVLSQAGEAIAARAVSFGQNTLHFLASAGIMLYVLFFLFRDGRRVGRNIREALPLNDDYSRRLLSTIAAVMRATVKGNIIIAALQGTIGGVTFWLLGIGAPLLWGVLMTFLSLLPAVGSALVWLPVAAYLLLSGAHLKGIILILVGAGAIGLVDNLLRPSLVGKDTRLPDYVVLVSTVGGIALFGINGFVIGPLIAALFVACWRFYRDEEAGHRGGAVS